MYWKFSFLPFLLLLFTFSASLHAQSLNTDRVSGDEEIGIGFGRRALLSFKETPQGSNVTFECSRSGPCVACLYSEKNDEKYRCSETGYRIPLKCVEIKDTSKVSNEKKSHNGRSMLDISYEHKVVPDDASGHASSTAHRNLRDGSVSSTDGPQSYITYRSCIPSVNEEKLSVLGFEKKTKHFNGWFCFWQGAIKFQVLVRSGVFFVTIVQGRKCTIKQILHIEVIDESTARHRMVAYILISQSPCSIYFIYLETNVTHIEFDCLKFHCFLLVIKIGKLLA
uniref:Uncharacterized protein n=1 Tax=Cucumis melo TaxID=3656 RepID=A0A9I9D249_CUCME